MGQENHRVKARMENKPCRLLLIGLCCWLGWGSTGCRHLTREPFYPLGIYGASSTNDLSQVKQAGFNLVVGPARRDFLDAAKAHQLRVLAQPNTTAGKHFNPAVARRAIQALDAHPSLWGWYLSDEPELHQVAPQEVKQAHWFFKMHGASKPTVLVLYRGAAALYYAHLADITMVDRYPVPWLPLANVGQHLQQVRLALGPQKPLLAVIQAFDWAAFPELMPGEKNLRPPSYDELRCMVYLALAQKVNGLFFFTYNSETWKIRQHPETWNNLCAVIGEVTQRLPLFQAEQVWWPYQHDFENPSQRFNAALESSISPALLHVKNGNENIPRGTYLLLVNNTENPHSYRITVPAPQFGSVAVLDENRSVSVKNYWLQDTLSAYAVHVYGPLDSSGFYLNPKP